MRVIAGAFKGRRLVVPRGRVTRPTADQVRTALMDTLAPCLADARVLDLFAGAGGVGLEALSRGAAHATFVEREPRAAAALETNVRALGVEGRSRVLRVDITRALDLLARERARFDIVFLDPPYEADLATATLDGLERRALVQPGGLAIVQHLTKRPPVASTGDLQAFRTRRFGETTLTFFRAAE